MRKINNYYVGGAAPKSNRIKALSEKEKFIGKIQKGISENVRVITGILNTGEASGIPIIKKLLNF